MKSLSVLTLIVLAMPAFADKPKAETIVGTWEGKKDGIAMKLEIKDETSGTLKVTIEKTNIEAKCSFKDGKVTMDIGDGNPQTMTYVLKDGKLTITKDANDAVEFTRVKADEVKPKTDK